MINSTTFAKRLKQLMSYYNLNASSFSDMIEFNRSTISHLLSGRNKPSLEFVMKVLNSFPEITIDWLLEGKGDFPNHQEKLLFEETHATKQGAPARDSSELDLLNEAPLLDNSKLEKQDFLQKMIDPQVSKKKIARIVIFYTDSSFEAYEN